MYRTLWGLLAAFVLVLGLVGLTFSRSTAGPAEFRFVNGAEPKTLDPGLATGEPEHRILSAIFEGLCRLDAKSLRPAPGAASHWEVAADGLSYVFHLRSDARWTDGSPVSAADFVYAWRRLLDPATGSEYAYILYPIAGAEALHTYRGLASQLRGGLLPALRPLARAPLSRQELQRLLNEHAALAALRPLSSPRLSELLDAEGPDLEAADSLELVALVSRVAEELELQGAAAEEKFGRGLGVVALDEHTLRVELKAPTPYFLQLMAFYPSMPVPRWVVEAHPDDWFLPEHIVSNGPFKLAEWHVNERIRLEKSSAYWGRDVVTLRSVDALPIENPNTALNLYLTGGADWLPSAYPVDLGPELRKRPDFYSGPALIVYFYRLNTKRKPFSDKRVRRAFNLAIDREAIVKDVLGLGQLPAYSMVPPGMPGYEPPHSALGLDVARAQALLAEAGYPGGVGFPDVGIVYNTLETHKKIAEVIADQLRRNLGVSAKAYNQEWQAYQATTRAMNYDMARAAWIGDYADPNTFLDMWVTNGGNNQTGFSSSTYDRLIAAAADVQRFVEAPESLLSKLKQPAEARRWLALTKAGDVQARERLRQRLLAEAEAILIDDELPIMPIYFYVVSGLRRLELDGFYSELELPDGSKAANLQDIHPLRDIRWAKAGGRQ